MPSGSVGVAVNQSPDGGAIQYVGDGGLIDIHDIRLFVRLCLFAAFAQADRQRQTLIHGLSQELLLPRGFPYLLSEALVGSVIGAELVAMGDQCRDAIQIDLRRVRQQRQIGRFGKLLAHEKVAVAR